MSDEKDVRTVLGEALNAITPDPIGLSIAAQIAPLQRLERWLRGKSGQREMCRVALYCGVFGIDLVDRSGLTGEVRTFRAGETFDAALNSALDAAGAV